MPELKLRLLGAPIAILDGVPVSFDTRKALALLAYLAVTGRPARRERLAGLLWPDSEQSKARAALRRTLSVAGAVGPALIIQRADLALDSQLTRCDVTEFEQLAAAGDPSSLRRAASLAPDDFLAGFSVRDSSEFDDWSTSTADRLRGIRTSVLARLTMADQDAGRLDEAIESARAWVALDPLSEAAHRELMRLYAWTGERTAALKQYRACVRALDRELGVPPLPETTELYDAVRRNHLKPPSADPTVTSDPVTASYPASRSTTSVRSGTAALALPLIGRHAEVERLLDQWKTAADGGAAAAVSGAPGVGRTSVVGALTAEVGSRGGAIASVRGHATEAALAFSGFDDLVRALSELDTDVATDLDPRTRSVEGAGDLVRQFGLVRDAIGRSLAGPQPGLLVVDDAQWWDPTSLDLLRYLLRRPVPNVFIVTTWIRAEHSLSGPGEHAETLRLDRWGVAEIATALDHLGATNCDPDEVLSRTGGVPRLVIEYSLATQSSEHEPATELRDLVGMRVQAAPDATRQVLGAAAVLGSVSDPTLLRQTSGREEFEVVEAIEDAVSRGLLVEDVQRGGYDVPYDALRDLLLEDMSLARLRLLHGRAADALMKPDASGVPAPSAIIARHLTDAGREEEAGHWHWRAASEAANLFAYREALDQLQAALAMGFDAAEVHRASGEALTRLGQYDRAIVEFEQAAAASNGERHDMAVIEHRIADVYDRLGEWSLAETHLEHALELLESDGPVSLRVQILADLAFAQSRQNDDRAAPTVAAALALAEGIDDETSLAAIYNTAGVLAVGAGDFDLATRRLQVSREHGRAAHDPELESAALNNLARLHTQTGALDEALEAAQAALALGEHHGDLHRVAALHNHVADLSHRLGRHADAMAHQKQAAIAFAEVDDGPIRPEVWKLATW